MRIKRVLVVVFLLVLYVVPTNVSASEWGTSEQSITSFSEETGWIHDCSNTTGITNTTSGDTVASDGDIITLTTDLDGGSFEITVSSITTADYPFLVLNCTSISSGDGWKLEQLNTPGGTWYTLQSDYATDTGIYRYNMKALSAGVETFRINVTQTATIKFDFFRAYSIANFTLTVSAQIDTYAYVDDDNALHYHQGVSGDNYIQLDYDPAISVSSTYSIWNITTGGYDAFYFKVQQITDSTWYWMVLNGNETTGALPENGIKDLYILFQSDSTDSSISDITFSGFVPAWEEVGTAIVYFNVPFDYWALNMGLIFGGLILMLLSACIVAKKVRDRNITNDAGILLLFLFCVGWGLFIGGTLIG